MLLWESPRYMNTTTPNHIVGEPWLNHVSQLVAALFNKSQIHELSLSTNTTQLRQNARVIITKVEPFHDSTNFNN